MGTVERQKVVILLLAIYLPAPNICVNEEDKGSPMTKIVCPIPLMEYRQCMECVKNGLNLIMM